MRKLVLVLSALAGMTACSSQAPNPAPAEKPQPKTAELVTGRAGLQKSYIAARGWAPDAKPFRVESQPARIRREKKVCPQSGVLPSHPTLITA